MGTSLQFPTLTPPQVVRDDNDFGDLAQLLVSIAQHRQQLGVRKQELAIQKKESENRIANDDANRADAKARREEQKREFELKEQQHEADEIVSNELPGILTAPGDLAQNAEAARVRLIQSNKKLAPFINASFNAQLKAATDARTAIANRRIAETGAKVAEGTAASDIAKSTADAERAAVELASAKTQQLLLEDVQQYGQRGSLAVQLLAQGATAGDAYRLAGVRLPAGVDPTYKLPASGEATQTQGLAESRLATFRQARDEALTVGAVPLDFLNSVRARTKESGLIGAPISALANAVSSEKQQRLFTAYRTVGEMWRRDVSGAQSSDVEGARLMSITTPLHGDKRETVIAKVKLWNAIEEGLAKRARNEWSPTQAVDNLIKVAKANGATPEMLRSLNAQRADAAKFEQSPGFKKATGAPAAPTDALTDPAMRRVFGGRP